MVEEINGEPTRPNASMWSSELGTRIRSYLDVTKSTFTDQDPRNVGIVIQQMENDFETIGGRISIKYYKYRMRILMKVDGSSELVLSIEKTPIFVDIAVSSPSTFLG